MARELKIPAEGRGWCSWRSKHRPAGTVGDVLAAGNVLDKVNMMCVIVVLVHALAGGPLTLELPSLR